ncbi:hypothetical protein [Hymenobacter fodinae]|uniref:Uncharacterized protein n=1 Tax=Hymenobacter fodinae TaxID=2510796 RepID=A0A4Z0PD58_9BACT|nr:hypothetical protein [Hymenobacter fodinae]TGE10527.1 hypothetical protein EU556_06885 [Hymenobacter fodinae]
MNTPTPNSAEQPNKQNAENQPGETPQTHQSDLTQDEGDGIRGGYGDADQTNGLEGGANAGPDGGPEHNS